ncbi:MAG TPA: DUF2218 domain-containing protein [Devosiaceae bacterium]|jgi:hypothetical protein|nr:DUF2218 domain-containing protein [Devosiaceae bacterium]
MTTITTTATGRWATSKASQYLRQLCKHFSHKVETRFDEHAGTIAFADAPVRLVATATELQVVVEGTNAEATTRYRDVIDSHLKRFAFRESFETMDWAEAEAAAA